MKTFSLALAATLAWSAGVPHAHAADEPQLQRLVSCQDSWLDWKDDGARMARFADYFETSFDRSPQGAAFAPKAPMKLLGHAVSQVYPQSVGTGVGFSALIDANFAQARASIEKQLGKPMTCSLSDGIRACELELGVKKTALLMTEENGKARTSLVGCYYFYQQ